MTKQTPPLNWRKSSYSGSSGSCFEIAESGEDLLVRNSNRPDEGTISFTRHELGCLIRGVKAGEFDDLT